MRGIFVVMIFIGWARPALCGVSFFKYERGIYTSIEGASVEKACGEKVVVRTQYREDAPKYLQRTIIKAIFGDKAFSTLDAAKKSINDGYCLWVSDDEKALLKK